MIHRVSSHLLFLLVCFVLFGHKVAGQNVFSNATTTLGSSDNTGGAIQPGSEVLNSTPGMGVIFDAGSTFEHVGQFYVAEDGIWNHSASQAGSTDYFGYAPGKAGSYRAYQGIGIKGASSINGGRGAGRPSFYNLELNSTGLFPVVAGIYVANTLAFNANGPVGSSIITTPSVNTPDLSANAINFAPTATIMGANEANYINGFASVTDVTGTFTLPLGDPADTANPLHTLTINNAISGTITACYLHTLQHSEAVFGTGINWVSPVGNWSIAAPAGTNVTVSMPALNLLPDEVTYLRLVGWNGRQWVDLSRTPTSGACVSGGCPLTGTLTTAITDLAIGSSRYPANVLSLTAWPNPTQGLLHLTMSADKTIDEIQVLNQQGTSMMTLSKSKARSDLDVTALPTGSYILEVRTTEGHTLRQHFIRQ